MQQWTEKPEKLFFSLLYHSSCKATCKGRSVSLSHNQQFFCLLCCTACSSAIQLHSLSVHCTLLIANCSRVNWKAFNKKRFFKNLNYRRNHSPIIENRRSIRPWNGRVNSRRWFSSDGENSSRLMTAQGCCCLLRRCHEDEARINLVFIRQTQSTAHSNAINHTRETQSFVRLIRSMIPPVVCDEVSCTQSIEDLDKIELL